jgi:hypothetical protein
VLVNVDGGDTADHGAWVKALTGQRGALVYAGNIHEIRGYNRLARAARWGAVGTRSRVQGIGFRDQGLMFPV